MKPEEHPVNHDGQEPHSPDQKREHGGCAESYKEWEDARDHHRTWNGFTTLQRIADQQQRGGAIG